jgi:cyclophilin family peptidyl-prolyl cis-trans isomerase
MNFNLEEIPDSGPTPIVWMDIVIKEEVIGRIFIRMFREVFPAGVENFIRIAGGRTIRTEEKGQGKYKFRKEIIRTYSGSKFFNFSHRNYIVAGDIYNNDGSRAGTIYDDEPIPPLLGNYFYDHSLMGLVSLVPFHDEQTGEIFYDSTFMITLDFAKPSNILNELNRDQIVIGQIYQGMEVIAKINQLLVPYAGRRYPDIYIGNCGIHRSYADAERRLRY